MAMIILTSLNRAQAYRRTYPHAQVCTMTAQPDKSQKVPNQPLFAPTKQIVFGHKHHAHPDDVRFQSYPPLDDEGYRKAYLTIIEERMDAIKDWE